MSSNIDEFDAIIVGTGQGGKPLAIALGTAGYRTAVIEENYVGGSCINYGCTPTKTMVASARIAYQARRAGEYGVNTGKVSVDMKKVWRRKEEIIKSWRDHGRESLEQSDNVELVFGTASFEGRHKIRVQTHSGESRMLTAERIIINSGAMPKIPDIPGLREVNYLDSTALLELDTLPGHLIVLGGGYVGLEFGQMFRRFGSKVTIIQRNTQLLPHEDTDIAKEVADILTAENVSVLPDTQTTHIAQKENEIVLTVTTQGTEERISGSHLLVATGREPNTARLNLPAAGIETDKRGYIPVNSRLETAVKGIYAIGDVKPGPAFTHISYDDFRILRTNLLENGNASIEGRLVPYTVFIDPQLGRVGLNEKEARKQNRHYRVAKLPMKYVARALESGETRGFMKVLVDDSSRQILGCAILGMEGGEVMAALQMAMMGEIPYTAIKEGVFAHPTLAESLNNLFMTLES